MSDTDALLHDFQSITDPLSLEELFPLPQPIELEIGCGDGGFLFERAQAHPERNFLGIERLLGRARKLSKKGLREGLTNLRLLRIEARYVLEYLLPEGAFEAVHIYFPDPWPKERHRRHRLINETFPPLARRILVSGGAIYLRTDDLTYFEQMQLTFCALDDFKLQETPEEISDITTEFERQWLAAGRQIHRVAYRLY